jgi:hypothetical protein
VLLLHVLVAVLGLGLIGSVTLVAGAARRIIPTPANLLQWLDPVLKYSGISLAMMLVTGVLLDLAASGSFRGFWWFRGAALLLLLAGTLHGQTLRAVRQFHLGKADIDTILRKVERLGYAMCALIVAITVMMEVRPF